MRQVDPKRVCRVEVTKDLSGFHAAYITFFNLTHSHSIKHNFAILKGKNISPLKSTHHL